MTTFHLKNLEQWCQDAVTLLPMPELPPSFVEARRETIRRHSGKRALYKIAEDLAEGIDDLPSEQRDFAQSALVEKYGFGFDLFTDAKFGRVLFVLKQGRIRNDDEYRELLDIVGDTTLGSELRGAINRALAEYRL